MSPLTPSREVVALRINMEPKKVKKGPPNGDLTKRCIALGFMCDVYVKAKVSRIMAQVGFRVPDNPVKCVGPLWYAFKTSSQFWVLLLSRMEIILSASHQQSPSALIGACCYFRTVRARKRVNMFIERHGCCSVIVIEEENRFCGMFSKPPSNKGRVQNGKNPLLKDLFDNSRLSSCRERDNPLVIRGNDTSRRQAHEQYHEATSPDIIQPSPRR